MFEQFHKIGCCSKLNPTSLQHLARKLNMTNFSNLTAYFDQNQLVRSVYDTD